MTALPETENSLLVRTSFTPHDRWPALVGAVSEETADGFRAQVEFINDPELDQYPWQDLRELAVKNSSHASVLFSADSRAIRSSEFEILVIDLLGDSEPFRCISRELWGVGNNLNIANMDWDDFANNTVSGVFRGFE